jgi:hypothetical protein
VFTYRRPWLSRNARPVIGQAVAGALYAEERAVENDCDIVLTMKTRRLIDNYVIVEEISAGTAPAGIANTAGTAHTLGGTAGLRLCALVNLRAKNKTEQMEPCSLAGLRLLLSGGA